MKPTVLHSWHPWLVGLGVFLFIYIFFTQAHPVYPFDSDDWTYLYHTRDAYPETAEYNPTRVMPEILMPLCGIVAMNVVYPLVEDVTQAICITSAALLALLIATYMLLFYYTACKRFLLGKGTATFLTLLFLTFHFLLFRHAERGNEHMFYSFDLCCHYNYTIPNLLASCLVLLFIAKGFEYFSLQTHKIAKGFFFLAISLCILSHVFASIILTAYLSAVVLTGIFTRCRKERKICYKSIIKQYWVHLSTICAWLLALPLEAFGRRATDVGYIGQTNFTSGIIESARNLKYLFFGLSNNTAIAIISLCFLIYIIIMIRQKTRQSAALLCAITVAFTISCVYLILMGAESYPYYLLRTMTSYAAPFFLILAAFICAATCLQYCHQLSAILPFLLVFSYCNCVRDGFVYLDVQTLLIPQDIQGTYRIPVNDIPKLNRDFLTQVKQADQRGETETTLLVPRFEHKDNWPLAYYHGMKLSYFMAKYSLTSQRIKINIITEDPTTGDSE